MLVSGLCEDGTVGKVGTCSAIVMQQLTGNCNDQVGAEDGPADYRDNDR